MKTLKLILATIIFSLLLNSAFSQQDTTGKLTKFRSAMKKKLIEKVGLSEQTAEKFLDLQTEFRLKVKVIVTKRKELMETIESNPEAQDIGKKLDELYALEDDAYKNRKNYITSLKEIMTPEQIAKTMLLQKSMRKMIKEKSKDKGKK